MQMKSKLAYEVLIRRLANGEEHKRLIFAQDEVTAKERAVVRARMALGSNFAERKYGQFEVLSCNLAPTSRI
jgi:hypothetical protein